MCERMVTRSLASRLLSGSSIKNTLGWRTMARASATRWRWPPDNSLGRRSKKSVSSTCAAALSTAGLICAPGMPRMRSGKLMFSSTVMFGYRP